MTGRPKPELYRRLLELKESGRWLTRPAGRHKAYRRGHRSEWLAALALMLKGYRIVARRYRTKLGEIDLIARRGDLVHHRRGQGAADADWRRWRRSAVNSERRIEGAADLWLTRQKDYGRLFGALRHGGRAAAPLAGACRERVPGTKLNESASRDPHRQAALRLRRQLLHRPRLGVATLSKRKRDSRMASAMTASCMAKLAPMQTRGPAPNGRYWKRSIFSRFAGMEPLRHEGVGLVPQLAVAVDGPWHDQHLARLGISKILARVRLDRLAVDRRRRRIEPQRLLEGGTRERHGVEPFADRARAPAPVDLRFDRGRAPTAFGQQ